MAVTSPLATWLPDDAALARFRRTALGRGAVVLPPCDGRWRSIVPEFRRMLDLVERGLPFHVVADRDHDRSPDPARLRGAVDDAATVLVPQAHQVLPRLARLIVALRAIVFGPFREECSYLFVVEGRGRDAMGLHHDGDTDGLWLQVEGRRTVTAGPPVPPGTPEELPASRAPHRGRGWSTVDLEPGTLFYLPARTPHRVVCHGRSLAVSLTWGPFDAARALGRVLGMIDEWSIETRTPVPPRADRRRSAMSPSRDRATMAARPSLERFARALERRLRRAIDTPLAFSRAWGDGLTAWDVTSGTAEPWPPDTVPGTLVTQVPVVAGPVDPRRKTFALWTPDGELTLPAPAHVIASTLAAMPWLTIADLDGGRVSLQPLVDAGILAEEDIPLVVTPDDPSALDGWRFA